MGTDSHYVLERIPPSEPVLPQAIRNDLPAHERPVVVGKACVHVQSVSVCIHAGPVFWKGLLSCR